MKEIDLGVFKECNKNVSLRYFEFGILKEFSTLVDLHWHRLVREVMESPSLDIV